MNSRPEYIHETIIKDIVDVVSDVKDAKELGGFTNKKSFRSVASASSNLTLVFPVLISSSISIEAAGMISKAIERKCVTMLQMLFSAFCIDDAKDAVDYLSKFHTNIDTGRGITMDNLINALDKYVVQAEESGKMSKEQIANYHAIMEDMKNLDYHLPDSVNETSLNKFIFSDGQELPTLIREAPENDYWNARKASSDYFKNQITPSDIKKANELVPTMMTIHFISTAGDGMEAIDSGDIMIGIKAKLYPIDSADMINRIKVKNQDNNGFNKFIRATTREISFFKDFVFAIDKAKIDAISQSRRGSSSKFWRVLERRSLKSKVRRSLGMTNDASAITTLVLSQEEVEYLRKTENIDASNPSIMRPIMEAYNLMGVVIVDEAQEIAAFMFDSGDDMFEQVSFTNLEREATDGSYKKIVNLMTKMH